MIRIKSLLKKVIKKTISYNLIHENFTMDSDKEVWKNLATLGFSPHAIIDIGAARGEWTKELINIYPSANYLLIEPLEENLSSIKSMCSENINIRTWQGIVSSYNGECCFFVHGDQSSIFNSEFKGSSSKVNVKTLDSLLIDMNFTNADAIKLDVQGAELEALRGADSSIKLCKVLQVEVSFRRIYENAPLAHELIKFVTDKGFRIFDITTVMKRKEDRALLQADIFFVSDDLLFKPESWNMKNKK